MCNEKMKSLSHCGNAVLKPAKKEKKSKTTQQTHACIHGKGQTKHFYAEEHSTIINWHTLVIMPGRRYLARDFENGDRFLRNSVTLNGSICNDLFA